MSIGKKEVYYTLKEVTTGNVYKFRYCKSHSTVDGSTYKYYCDDLGDDCLDFVWKTYGDRSKQYQVITFKFNELVGCIVEFEFYYTASLNRLSCGVKMYIKDKGTSSNANIPYRFYTSCDIDGYYSDKTYPGCGLMFGYMDNASYQGVTIIPFHFIAKRGSDKIVHKVDDFILPYYQPTKYGEGAAASGSGYTSTTASDSSTFLPANYLLKSYYTLSFSDSGDISKQQAFVVNGFPYGDGESTSQGGQGEMTDTSDPIEIDSKPMLTTGDFLRVYKLTATDLTALQNKLISNGFLDGLIPKLRTDAMDYIVGLNAIPISATNVAASTIKIANLDTEINASYLSWYIEDIDFGEIALNEYFQTFMDYSPYTKLSVYIPYCGIVPLNVDNFMNDKISMKCRVDMLTGQFVVFVSNSVGVVTTVSGNCAYQLPIRANDYNRLVTSGLGLLGGIVGTAGALATGNVPLAVGMGLGTVGGLVATSQAMTKPDVTSKGSLGGNYGLLGNRTPYLIIQRPTISVPSDYGKTIGYMSRITAKLGDLTGYTVVEEIHLEHISATDDEKKLIETALKSGVIL